MLLMVLLGTEEDARICLNRNVTDTFFFIFSCSSHALFTKEHKTSYYFLETAKIRRIYKKIDILFVF